jgi:hypothetical protein
MGSSFTEFRGKGFWSRDWLLEPWLRILSLHLEEEVYEPGWQHDLRDEWLFNSAGFFNGCISASLDTFLTDDERIAVMLRVSERSLQSLRAFGPHVPGALLDALGLYPHTADLPIEWFERIAQCFTSLLRGELTTDASTSPVLPATKLNQGWDEIEQPRDPKQ